MQFMELQWVRHNLLTEQQWQIIHKETQSSSPQVYEKRSWKVGGLLEYRATQVVLVVKNLPINTENSMDRGAGGLGAMEPQKVAHDWAHIRTCTYTPPNWNIKSTFNKGCGCRARCGEGQSPALRSKTRDITAQWGSWALSKTLGTKGVEYALHHMRDFREMESLAQGVRRRVIK